MNKKDIEKEKRIREKEDEEKLLNAIHKNASANRDRFIMQNNFKKLKKEKLERKTRNCNKILTAIVATCLIIILFLTSKYTDDSISKCIKNGNSEYFCEKNLR